MDVLFKVAFFVGMVAQIVIRAPYDRQRRKIEKTDQRVTASEQAVLAVLTIGGLVLPLVYALSPWLAFADYPGSPMAKAVLGGLGLVFLLYLVRVTKEEAMMLDHFGDEYRAYCARTGRIVPRASA